MYVLVLREKALLQELILILLLLVYIVIQPYSKDLDMLG